MYCRIVFLLSLLVFWIPCWVFATEINVSVKGLEGELLKNVLALLEINLHRDNPRISTYDIHRLYKKGDADIRMALAPYGYYDPTIDSSLVEKEETFTAKYTVKAGEPVRISMIDLEVVGPGREAFDNLFEQFPLQVGDILNQETYEQGKRRITIAAMRKGYLKASFARRELLINRSEKRAEIHLYLDTGPQFVFGETSFEDDSVQNELLQRYLPYQPGDPYRPGKLIELQKLLYGTEFFSRVSVDGQPDKEENFAIPVNVRLTPPEHLNRYSVGLGYATDTGARVRFEWWNRLLNSWGHQVRASAQVSQYDSNLRIDYTLPWLDPKRDTLGYSLGYQDLTWDDTDTRLATAGVRVERKGKLIRHGGSFEFRNEDYTVGVTSGSSVLFVPTYTGTVIWADDLLKTKYGLDLSLSVSGASEALGSDASYLKGLVNGKTIITLLPGLRFIGRGSLGTILVDSIDNIPPSLRFYAGGDQSVRGYAYRELGTKDASGAVVGGRYLVVGSGEIEKSIADNWSLAAFWDVGNAMDDLSIDLKNGVGGGFRYRLPFGQVRVDIASAISEEGSPFRLHLTVGADL
ncbi:autotransporter assembly complex protein TamA [Desulfopila aestuarii]|uniref:Translocation and assembly module subunit TamA n=1 Tax=Desulfopila aestuarii DSM 18488 TaxID=1121416 RepID=A0A1M7Y8A4_9BACT|nr:autotransporter assembly complex family protein [Desulfopila aestuarii]SHO48801.1 autotransporter secretion outer membrane protein TamA [Desulfopila aestuarii DSM 18488]